MQAENEKFMLELSAKHGPFYAQAAQMVSICYATTRVLVQRQDCNEDAKELTGAFEILASETYVQYAAMCRTMGTKPVGGAQMGDDAKALAQIVWKMQEQISELEKLPTTGAAN